MTAKPSTSHGVAILGCGAMGGVHAEAWSSRDDARVLSVFDVDRTRADALAAKTGASACASWQEAIETDDVTMVSVCTPICFHADMTIHAARHGCHILCEKAMALTLEAADAMIEAAATAGVTLVIGFQHRANPYYRTWQSLIEREILSGPLFIRLEDVRGVRPKTAMHRQGLNGGPIIDMAGHHFDLVRYFTGAEPVRVTAAGHCYGRSKPELAAFDDLAVDAAEILVEYSDGHILSCCINWGLPAGHPGYTNAQITSADVVSKKCDDRISVRRANEETLYDCIPGTEGTKVRVNDLVAAAVNDTRPEVAGEDGRIALAVCLAALKSIETGQTVEL